MFKTKNKIDFKGQCATLLERWYEHFSNVLFFKHRHLYLKHRHTHAQFFNKEVRGWSENQILLAPVIFTNEDREPVAKANHSR